MFSLIYQPLSRFILFFLAAIFVNVLSSFFCFLVSNLSALPPPLHSPPPTVPFSLPLPNSSCTLSFYLTLLFLFFLFVLFLMFRFLVVLLVSISKSPFSSLFTSQFSLFFFPLCFLLYCLFIFLFSYFPIQSLVPC